MTRSEQVAFCRKCTNRKFDNQQGLICRLTDKKANFLDSCPDFQVDHSVEDKVQINTDDEILTPGLQVISNISDQAKDKLRRYQDFRAALIGGSLAALISALFWAILDVGFTIPLTIQFLAKGAMIGLCVRYFGAGIDQKFGILGGLLALLSCATGIVFTEIGLIAKEFNVGFLEALNFFDFTLLFQALSEIITPIDIIFSGVSIYESYRLAFRGFSSRELAKIDLVNFDPKPPGYAHRRSATFIASAMLLGILFLFNLPKPSVPDFSSHEEDLKKQAFYPDGSTKAQGNYRRGLKDDVWSFWYPNGAIEARGFFKKGVRDSHWTWYSKNSSIIKEGVYSRGLKSQKWTNYYDNGRIKDSCQYLNGRQQGTITRFYDTGELKETGTYKEGIAEGLWISYYKNGKKKIERTIINEAGQVLSDSQDKSHPLFLSDFEIVNAWDKNGNQTVINGNGSYSTYYDTGELKTEGTITNKQKAGVWKTWFKNGNLAEEGTYINNIYHLHKSWTASGKEVISDANGNYESFDISEKYLLETGNISNGLREGTWTTYYPKSDQPMLIANYEGGKSEGMLTYYYPSGSIKLQGLLKGGMKTGKWVAYFEDSTIKSTTLFENGLRHGSRTVNNEQGKQLIEETYESGKLVSEKLLIEE